MSFTPNHRAIEIVVSGEPRRIDAVAFDTSSPDWLWLVHIHHTADSYEPVPIAVRLDQITQVRLFDAGKRSYDR